MRVVDAHRRENTLHVLWEDGREQTIEIIDLYELLQLRWLRFLRRPPTTKKSSRLFD